MFTSVVLRNNMLYKSIKEVISYNFFRYINIFSEDHIKIIEVGLRDGLQNHKTFIPTEKKNKLIYKLVKAGITDLEATSFVSPKAIPQMADSSEVMEYCNNTFRGINFSALVPNINYYNKSLESNLKSIAIFTTASETFCNKNLRCSIDESLERYKEVCKKAKKNGNFIRGYVSCIAGCPFEGDISINKIVNVCQELLDMGCDEISLGDTIGIGTPEQIENILNGLSLNGIPMYRCAVHFHDTNGRALDNIMVSLKKGISVIDSSINGLGGCPFAPGAPGNVATEKVVEMLHGLGLKTGIDISLLNEAKEYAKKITI